MPVYMIRAGTTDAVKIGWTANDVEKRRRELQVAHHEDLNIMKIVAGGRSLERRLHSRFASRHISREWFRFDPAMLEIDDEDAWADSTTGLSGYLENGDVTASQLATLLGVHVSQVSRWASGDRKPSLDQAAAIMAVTKGAVTFEDLAGLRTRKQT